MGSVNTCHSLHVEVRGVVGVSDLFKMWVSKIQFWLLGLVAFAFTP